MTEKEREKAMTKECPRNEIWHWCCFRGICHMLKENECPYSKNYTAKGR